MNYFYVEWAYKKHGRRYYKRKPYETDIQMDTIIYDEIINYLPTNIVTTVFSIHNEHPKKRPPRYYGYNIVESYDIDNIYVMSHFNEPSVSNGMAKFLKQLINQNSQLSILLEDLGLKFSGNIKVYVYSNNECILNLDGIDDWINIGNFNRKESNEMFECEVDNGLFINDILFNKNGQPISLENMSSGEKMFFYRVFSIMRAIDNDSLVIIEYSELHINPAWVKQIITVVYYLFRCYDAHFIIATFSHLFINTLFPENILIFGDNEIYNPNFNTFLSNEREVTLWLFDNSNMLNYIEETLVKLTRVSDKNELKTILNYLGESIYGFMAFNKLSDIE